MGQRLDRMADVVAAENLRRALERVSGREIPIGTEALEGFVTAADGIADRLEALEWAVGPYAVLIPSTDLREAVECGECGNLKLSIAHGKDGWRYGTCPRCHWTGQVGRWEL